MGLWDSLLNWLSRVKRRKVEMLESMKDPEGLTPHVEAEESLGDVF